MERRRYQLTLTFRGPLMSQASGTLAFGLDSAMLRDSEGYPVLGGSLIRGNVRETLLFFAECMAAADPNRSQRMQGWIKSWFGEPSSNAFAEGGFEPHPGSVQFDFYWRFQPDAESGIQWEKDHGRVRHRIAIDENGRVKQSALQVMEDCFPLGSEPVFCGHIQAEFADAAEAAQFERLLDMALDYIPAMGSFKGIGFGKRVKHDLRPDPSGPNLQVASGLTDRLDGTESRFGIEFTLDRPFCIGKPRTPDSNRIISDDIIPGNVLKALLANALGGNQTVLDGLRFDQWRVSHCLPMLAGSVGRVAPVMPLSLAKTGEEESPITEGQAKAKKQAVFHDMRALTLAQLAAIDWQQAPAFQPDWKDKDLAQIREKLGLSANRPKRILQVRTAIRAATGTAAQGQLFSMECVIPAGFVWRGTIDLGALPEAERKTALQQLSKTLGQRGLGNLGKTKAGLQNIKLLAKPFDSGNKTQNTSTATVKTLQPGEHLTLTLTLLTPARLFALGWERDDASRSAWDLYTRYWEQVSAGALVLTNFFAQQERQGGAYHYQHFQRHKDDKDGQYKPEWLTVAGSVFVLQVLDAAAAQDQITAWLQTGLPILEGDALTWKDTPYLPEHGFGEVVMNWQVADIPAYPVAEQGGGR